MSDKLIRLVKLMIRFRDGDYPVPQMRMDLRILYDLDAFLRALEANQPVVVVKKPPVDPTKEHFHAHCFDDFVRRERGYGVYNIDKGSRPFSANLTGRCHACSLTINVGDSVVVRRNERVEA